MAIDTKALKKPTKQVGKGVPPAPTETKQNLAKPPSGGNVPVQLKISPELRREFRIHAAERDLDLNALFVEVWEFYKEHH